MLNEKMQSVAKSIEEVITKILPATYSTFVFDERNTIEEIIGQILIECCKYAHDNTAERHSLNFYMKQLDPTGDVDDSERMMYKRTVDYINERRANLHEVLLNRGIIIEGLLSKNMDTIADRLSGYKFNSFQFWEIRNVHDMRLVKAIVERRILKKNFNNNLFKEYADEYDNTFISFLKDSGSSEENAVFSFLTMFTLECKYSFSFFYELATEMVKCKVSEIPDVRKRIGTFCSNQSVNSLLVKINPKLLGGTIDMESRMLLLRRKYIQYIVTSPEDELELDLVRFRESLFIVAAMLTRMTYQEIPIREWFIQNTTSNDWISVFRHYDVFQAFVPNKDWTDKNKIRYVKELYNIMSYDYKNPENRS